MATEIHPCTKDDIPELKAKFAQWYRYNPLLQDEAYIDWQFKSSPFRTAEREYDLFLLFENDRLCGCFGYSGFQLKIDQIYENAIWSHNWINESSDSIAGLKLLAEFQKVCPNRLLVRLNEMSEKICKIYKIPVLERMPRWWVSPNPKILAEITKQSATEPTFGCSGAGLFGKSLDLAPMGQLCGRLEEKAAFKTDRWKNVTSGGVRDAAYLNWRYVDIPKHTYQIITDGDNLAVFRVEPIMHTPYVAIRILEWLVDEAHTGNFLSRLMQGLKIEEVALIDFYCTAVDIGNGLMKHGFLPENGGDFMVPDMFRPTNHSGGYQIAIDLPKRFPVNKADLSNFYMTAGDSDIDRMKL